MIIEGINETLNKLDLEDIKKEFPDNINNIENILGKINDIILQNINEYKYKNFNLEKRNYELHLENLKLKFNNTIYNKLNTLPSELFHKILTFIDFKTLLECRMVSKNWYDKVSLISHVCVNLKNNKDYLIYWKKFCEKKIPSKKIIFCDSNNNFKEFINELIKNDNFLGIMFYIDISNGQGIYANKIANNKNLKIFGDIDVIYENIKFFKPLEIIISETSINRKNFKNIIDYCRKLKDKKLRIIFDNSITFLCIKKYIEWYNLNCPQMYNISIKDINVVNENNEFCYKLIINIDHMTMDEYDVNYEKLQCLMEIHISEDFKFMYKQRDDIMKKINDHYL